jgi:hypothetical protein
LRNKEIEERKEAKERKVATEERRVTTKESITKFMDLNGLDVKGRTYLEL